MTTTGRTHRSAPTCDDSMAETMIKADIYFFEVFQITRLQLFEIIDELFSDTAVKNHHEKLFTRSSNDDLAKSRFAPFCSTGEDFSCPAIRNELGHFHPNLRPAREAHQTVYGLPNKSFATI